jgi:3',5'-nucleoside bisphosphate phosphatase
VIPIWTGSRAVGIATVGRREMRDHAALRQQEIPLVKWFLPCRWVAAHKKEVTLSIQISSEAPIDLQLHTTYSDGRWSAEQLFDHLAHEGFALVAVTDHDRVDTVAGIQQVGAQKNVLVLPAVEISAEFHGKMADVLCFGFDPHETALRAIADDVRQRQKENAEHVYEELLRRGYQFPQRAEVLPAAALRVAGDWGSYCSNMAMWKIGRMH